MFKLIDMRRKAYAEVFKDKNGERVLADLKRFCHGDSPTFVKNDPNGREQAYREGRREVWLRIIKYLNLTPAEIEALQEKI